MPYLRYLCLFACSGVQHILCCALVWFVFLRIVYPILAVFLDCPFVIAPSVMLEGSQLSILNNSSL